MGREGACVRPGAWLCLLGSMLALSAFFLPPSGLPPGSLWTLLRLMFAPSLGMGELGPLIGMSLVVLLLLLVSIAVLATLRAFVGSLSNALLPWYRTLTILTLIFSLAGTLFDLLLVVLFTYMESEPLGEFFGPIYIGVSLLLVGLLLALLGDSRLRRRALDTGG